MNLQEDRMMMVVTAKKEKIMMLAVSSCVYFCVHFALFDLHVCFCISCSRALSLQTMTGMPGQHLPQRQCMEAHGARFSFVEQF